MHETMKFGVGNGKMYHGFSVILLTLFLLQYVTGAILSMLYVYGLDASWEQLRQFASEWWYVWLLRDLHMLGANWCILLLATHISKVLGCRQQQLSILPTIVIGSTIFLLSLVVCFTGYVLVCGQMSYWALTVILNLVTVIPGVGDMLVTSLLAGSSTTDVSIRRVFTAHWVLASLVILLIALHLVCVHRSSPSSHTSQSDSSTQLVDILLKDTMLLPLMAGVLLSPTARCLVHPDNWIAHDTIRTPAHIEPEPYFLWLFCMLKSRPSKIVGVVIFFSLTMIAILSSCIKQKMSI